MNVDLSIGEARRFFWRVTHRYGSTWWETPRAVIRRELRMVAHRRAL